MSRLPDLAHFTPAGRDQFRRVVLLGILKAKRLDAPPALLERALEQGHCLELVRHLEELQRAGGAV